MSCLILWPVPTTKISAIFLVSKMLSSCNRQELNACVGIKPSGDLFSHRTCSPTLSAMVARSQSRRCSLRSLYLVSSVWDGSRKPACVFVESPQQAAAGAISASFTGGTAKGPFHLGQGYGFVPPEQKTTMHHRLDQTENARVCVCVWVCVCRGGALCTTSITAVDWVAVGGSYKDAHEEVRKGLHLCLVILDIWHVGFTKISKCPPCQTKGQSSKKYIWKKHGKHKNDLQHVSGNI